MNECTIDEFLRFRASNLLKHWVDGVYLITNKTKQMHYVGQSSHVRERVFVHFVGRGNGDIYHDYKLGDEFTVRYYTFNPYQFRDINELEYHLIRIYESNIYGYNRQIGNKSFISK